MHFYIFISIDCYHQEKQNLEIPQLHNDSLIIQIRVKYLSESDTDPKNLVRIIPWAYQPKKSVAKETKL